MDFQYGYYVPTTFIVRLAPCVTTFGFWIPSQTENFHRSIPNIVSIKHLFDHDCPHILSFLPMSLSDSFREFIEIVVHGGISLTGSA